MPGPLSCLGTGIANSLPLHTGNRMRPRGKRTNAGLGMGEKSRTVAAWRTTLWASQLGGDYLNIFIHPGG